MKLIEHWKVSGVDGRCYFGTIAYQFPRSNRLVDTKASRDIFNIALRQSTGVQGSTFVCQSVETLVGLLHKIRMGKRLTKIADVGFSICYEVACESLFLQQRSRKDAQKRRDGMLCG